MCCLERRPCHCAVVEGAGVAEGSVLKLPDVHKELPGFLQRSTQEAVHRRQYSEAVHRRQYIPGAAQCQHVAVSEYWRDAPQGCSRAFATHCNNSDQRQPQPLSTVPTAPQAHEYTCKLGRSTATPAHICYMHTYVLCTQPQVHGIYCSVHGLTSVWQDLVHCVIRTCCPELCCEVHTVLMSSV
jgi:hypothetical protein